jgi:hypothetical protein
MILIRLINRTQENGPPHLSFTNHCDWRVETKTVRIRQVATYTNQTKTCELDITQVQCMKVTKGNKSTTLWHLTAAPDHKGRPDDGYSPLWYEACVRSTKLDRAFSQNTTLGFAEETEWTTESLKSSGAIDELMKSASDIVKQIDGVAYWCNNQQDSMKHGMPPYSDADARLQETVNNPTNHQYHYW